jgi:uncharacterized protein YneF (UPF0154 family)
MNVIQIATIAICPVLAYLAGLLIGIFLITKCMSRKAMRNKVLPNKNDKARGVL